jgi:thioesterase domain-containing protein
MKVTRFIQARAVITSGADVLYCPERLTLFRSAYQEWDRLGMPDDLGWGQFCPEVSVRRVPGDHWSLMAADNVQATATAVIDALRESTARVTQKDGPRERLSSVSLAPPLSPSSIAPSLG